MNKTKILIGDEARNKLVEGAKLVYDVVSETLGAKSSNVAISRQWGTPRIVHDGVTIAREIVSDDPSVNQGVRLIIESATKTVSDTGDGTTTSTILSYHLIKAGMDAIKAGEINAIQLRDELRAEYDRLVPVLSKMARKTKSFADIEQVATISSTSKEIGTLVAKAYDAVGLDGIVTTDSTPGVDDYLETTKGMQFDSGWMNRYFITNIDRMDATIDDPYILIVNKKISIPEEIFNALEAIVRRTKNIVIIGDISGAALASLVLNKQQGKLNCLVIRPPYHAQKQVDTLEDIAIQTGARILSDEIGIDLKADKFDISWCGRAQKVQSTERRTMIVGGRGSVRLIDKHLDRLRAVRSQAKTDMEREPVEERIARLTTGVSVIRVGGKTETLQDERMERVKDAIGAARSALEEGIVPGAGLAYMKLFKQLPGKTPAQKVLAHALQQPLQILFRNAGASESDVMDILGYVMTHDDTKGYDMMTGNLTDLMKSGIIDPTKVVRLALENAVTVAGSILTTKATIAHTIESLEMNE